MNKGKKLVKKLAVVSTGGPVPPDREALALKNSEELGLKIYQSYSCSKYYADYTNDFSNGSPDQRLVSIKEVLEDDTIDCILASRGATGSFDIISNFPFELFSKKRKLLIGNSDVTSILVQMPERANLCAIHGPTFGSSFADYQQDASAKESVDQLLLMIGDPAHRFTYCGDIYKSGQEDEGQLICGNLTMLVSILGTPYDVSYENKILVLEEVGEAPYRVKRLLEQLYFANKFSKLKGVCFGRFSKCCSPNGPSVDDVIKAFCNLKLQKYNFPILINLEVGHWGKNLPIPIGCMAKISGNSLIQLESPISDV